MTIERFYARKSHDVVVFYSDHLGYYMEEGLWVGENGSHDVNEVLAGDTEGLNQGSKRRETEFDRHMGGKTIRLSD